jgi:hypothetical protein
MELVIQSQHIVMMHGETSFINGIVGWVLLISIHIVIEAIDWM